MNRRIKKQRCGYEYSTEGDTWSVATDYLNGKIYLSEPGDEDIEEIKRFGIAISRAVADMQKDTK